MTAGMPTPPRVERLHCACGNDDLLRFSHPLGPDEVDPVSGLPGLVCVLTCVRCGEQLRVYQTSDAWRAACAARVP